MSEKVNEVDCIVHRVFEFNEQIIGIHTDELNPLTPEQHRWLVSFVHEELTEFSAAFGQQDIVGMCDAVGDLIYGAMGAFKKMGLNREQVRGVFAAIHAANMTKRRGNKGRGSDEDAVKPEGFVPPEEAIADLLFLE